MASAQLQLIDTERPWKLDRHTVEIGRAGVAKARAALAAASEVSSSEMTPFEALAVTEPQQLDLHRVAA